jgi:tetratricopeptide (TPR) repeat protein
LLKYAHQAQRHQNREETVTGIRKLIWTSWFIGTGLVLLSWLRLVGNDVGWYGTYIAATGWLVSIATSTQSKIPRIESESIAERHNLSPQTANEYRAIISRLTRRLHDAPQNRTRLLISRGAHYRALGDWDAAIADLDVALASNPDGNGEAYLNRGVALLQNGRTEETLSDFEASITRFLDNPSESENLSYASEWQIRTLIRLEQYEEALSKCEETLHLPLDRELDTRMFRGISMSALGKNDDAVNELNFVIDALDDNDEQTKVVDAFEARAGAFLAIGNIAEAISDVEYVQGIDGLAVSNLNLRAQAEFLLEDYRAARNCYQKAITIDPSHADSFAQLAVIQACCPAKNLRDGKIAEENARQACELSERNDWTHISVLAAAKAEQGHFKQAI